MSNSPANESNTSAIASGIYTSCAFVGTVWHKRLSPKQHAFTYRVFSLCLDVDEIDRLDHDLRFFSRNRRNVVSFHDADFGAGGGERVGSHVRRVLADAGLSEFGDRIRLLCYPRLFGYVFNPLSVYFCYAADARLGAIVYEVSNTFHERKSYVIPVASSDETVVAQTCEKEMYVSPFTSPAARYRFNVRPPASGILVGVDLNDSSGPVLKTHFTGTRLELTDRALLGLLARYPLMTAKVVAGIHFEATRLWLKGVPLVARHRSPSFSFTVVKPAERDASHAR